MAIVSPDKMNFSDKHIIMILAGLPGTWKTSTACSAPGVLIIDTDEGMARVNPEFRRDTSICKTYEEVLEDIKAADGKYETIVIDTCGALIEYMKDWAMRTDPKATKKDGGFSLQGYGIIKSEFIRLSAEMRKKFNVIYIFHEQMSRNGDDGIFYDLVADGSCKVICWQPADLGGHLFIQNGKHYIGFTPTEQYSAKSAYGIKGLIEVPELKPGQPNDFLTKLFAQIRTNLQKEAGEMDSKMKEYKATMEDIKNVIADVKKPEDIPMAMEMINSIPNVLTSAKEGKALMSKRMKELGITYDKATKEFRYIDQKS